MLTLRGSPRAYAGVKYGSPDYVLEEYFERWADRDALGSAAGAAAFRRNGRASTAEIYPRLDEPRRQFVDDFLRRTHTRHQVSFELPCAGTNGYLTVMQDEAFDAELVAAVESLLDPLTQMLRARLPRGIDAGLSAREAHVSELVALGLTNREIANVLHVEEDTVKKHVSRAMARLGVRHRSELAVAWATGARLDVPLPRR